MAGRLARELVENTDKSTVATRAADVCFLVSLFDAKPLNFIDFLVNKLFMSLLYGA
jgi:D-arabinose 5-phosphate isomerase GutQ